MTEQGKQDRLFQGIQENFEVYQWHEDMFEIPKNGTLLAESANCPHQALKVGERAYGLQFHIEVTKDIISDWVYNDFKDENGKLKLEGKDMIERYLQVEDMFNHRAETIYKNFLKIMTARKATV